MSTEIKPEVIGVAQLYKVITEPTFWLWRFTQPEKTGDTILYAFLPAEAVLADKVDTVEVWDNADAVLESMRKTEGLYYHGGDPRQETDDYIAHVPNR